MPVETHAPRLHVMIVGVASGAVGHACAGPRAFRYRDFGTLASISRSSAEVDLRGLRFSGFAGWLFRPFAHIFFLTGLRNRLAVMWSWTWSCLTWQHNARIIVGDRARGVNAHAAVCRRQ